MNILGTYEMDSNLFTKITDGRFVVVDTAISYNNDLMLRSMHNGRVISKMNTHMLSRYDFFMDNHLRCLGRRQIDMMLVHDNGPERDALFDRLRSDTRINEVGVSNYSIQDLESHFVKFGSYPSVNEVELNPEYYPKDLIDFCKKAGIRLICYGIFGGKYKSRRLIERYTLPVLYSYAARHGDVILRPDSADQYHEDFGLLDESLGLSLPHEERDRKAIRPYEYTPNQYVKALKIGETFISSKDGSPMRNESIPRHTFNIGAIPFVDANVYAQKQFKFFTDYLVHFRYSLGDDVLFAHGNQIRAKDNVTYMLDVLDNKRRITKLADAESTIRIAKYVSGTAAALIEI